ncbi:MAG: hypothetical protein NVS4B11_38420 [Ktedonobacteraceae bacterium]
MFVSSLKKRLGFLLTALPLFLLLNSCTSFGAQNNQQTDAVPTATPISITVPSCRSACNAPGLREIVDTWDNIHLFQSFDYNIRNPTPISRYYDFVWGVTPNKVAAFRAGNPNVFISYYLPFHRDGGTFMNADLGQQHDVRYWKSFHADWVLYKCDRTTPALEYGDPNIPLDFTNPDVVRWQVQTYAQPASTSGYDAIAADNLNLENLFGACGFYKNGQWVQRYTGETNDQQWRNDILTWVTAMQTALHALPHPLALIPNFSPGPISLNDPVVGNIVTHVDGILDEGGFTNYGDGYLTGTRWLQTIQFIRSVQIQQHKPYYISNEFKSDALDHNEVQWALASYLMCKEHSSSLFITNIVNNKQNYGADRRYSEYGAQIGNPKSEMYLAQNVYWRDYSNGLVVVNPSDTDTYTVKTSAATYRDLYGNHVSQTFSIPPHSGMVLIPS